MELIAYLIGLFVSAFLSLPPPLQAAVVSTSLLLWVYRKGWNDSVDAAYLADIQKANDTRRARRR
jgi:hypothetical protein